MTLHFAPLFGEMRSLFSEIEGHSRVGMTLNFAVTMHRRDAEQRKIAVVYQ